MRNRLTVALLAVALLTAATAPALAHRMLAVARPREDGTVLLRAFFADGKPARGVSVEVRRPDGSVFRDGRTDSDGRLVVHPEGAAGEWTAVFKGSMGHTTETTFRVASVGGEAETAGPTSARGTAGEQLQAREQAKERASAPAPGVAFPWTECLAGLGFIFGAAALAVALKARAEVRRLKEGGS